ncbi:hypothetical protein E3E12_01655 [Formicincola oecophyllae]|uniref:Uncharacterized protein n=1 Tax=Formicincola oecophyllae TaxID=2558361 RepID=A0A4Y6UAF0_9PROT|nr:hypothetical protein [Formicincola oecophyllae]QDH13115.1 hypothetical protein E3E12_01655 [Formicincola oecophyllae]
MEALPGKHPGSNAWGQPIPEFRVHSSKYIEWVFPNLIDEDWKKISLIINEIVGDYGFTHRHGVSSNKGSTPQLKEPMVEDSEISKVVSSTKMETEEATKQMEENLLKVLDVVASQIKPLMMFS